MTISNTTEHADPATALRTTDLPANMTEGLESLNALSRKISVLDEALAALAGLGDDSTGRSVARLRRELAGFEPSVTLLGQVKSGKTALVNAMAGWADLLPSDVNPWTSVVTSLHLKPKSDPVETAARFTFMSEDEWERLLVKGGRIGELAERAGAESEMAKIRDQVVRMREKSRARLGQKFEMLMGQSHEYDFFDKNLVERYICLGDDLDNVATGADMCDEQGRFADITKSADLYLNSKAVPCRLCLRDTPGVNDTFMMREQVTIQAIRDSRLCVVVLSAHQALSSVDMGLIRLISTLEARDVVIFVNRIDELADPANQIPEIRASIVQTLRNHHGPTEAEIVFGSAYWAGRALSGGIEDMAPASSAALLNWAHAALGSGGAEQSPADMVWQLSGLPELWQALGARLVETCGEPQVARIAGSAVTIASSLLAGEAVTIAAAEGNVAMSTFEIAQQLDQIGAHHLGALKAEFDELIAAHHQRADRVHDNFIQRATHSLIAHLERHGDETLWEYSPTGLRMLLRSAYNVFGTRAQAAATRHYEAAVADLAGLYARAFGAAVGGIEIAVPTPPPIPSPVVLGQAIALDFRDGWWRSWWRRTRGYKAFARRFRGLIAAETEDFMDQLKNTHTADIRDGALAVLSGFMEEQREILSGLGVRAHAGGVDVQELFYGRAETQRRKKLQSAMDTLSRYAA